VREGGIQEGRPRPRDSGRRPRCPEDRWPAARRSRRRVRKRHGAHQDVHAVSAHAASTAAYPYADVSRWW